MKIRTFIAIEIDEEIRKSIRSLQDDLKKYTADIKWVRPKNVHLTLKFLGDIQQRDVRRFTELLEECLHPFEAFDISLDQLGAFPHAERPRILWIGISQNGDLIKKIAEDVENALCKFGIKKEDREFGAHITIGRVRSGKNIQAIKEALLHPPSINKPQRIDKVAFLKSTLTPQGPIYEKLHVIKLK